MKQDCFLYFLYVLIGHIEFKKTKTKLEDWSYKRFDHLVV